jgi:hypothetical protein
MRGFSSRSAKPEHQFLRDVFQLDLVVADPDERDPNRDQENGYNGHAAR